MKGARLTYLSAEDYLALEQTSDIKHEYVAGQVFAMVGARDTHNTVALNIASRLMERLRGGPCCVFISDVKLRVEAADAFYYPDVFVTCDPRNIEPYFKRYPSVIVEVLSPLRRPWIGEKS
jgi:Uma2 family endonuclease